MPAKLMMLVGLVALACLCGCHTVEGMRRDLEEATVAVETWQQETADAIDEAFHSEE